MIAATPVIGAHYVIDIVGGAGVAAGSIWLAKHLFQIFASQGISAVEGSLSAGTVLQYGSSR
jgi:membrane-associated phospholipid phosphatase